jgi:hypothetical protein
MQERLQYIQDLVSQGLTDQEIKIKLAEFDNQPGKLKDPVKETAIAGSANTSSTDLNLEDTSSELPKNPNREKLIQLETELAATMADPKTMNSDENFRKRKSLNKQIKELGGLKQIKEEKLENVIVEPKESDVNLKRRQNIRNIAANYLKTNPEELSQLTGIDGRNLKELSRGVNQDQFESTVKETIKNIYFNQSSEGELLPMRTTSRGRSEFDDVAVDNIFREELAKAIGNENTIANQQDDLRINEQKKTGVYREGIKNTYNKYFKDENTPDQNKYVGLKMQLDELDLLIQTSEDEQEIEAAKLKRAPLQAEFEKIGSVPGVLPEGASPYLDYATLEYVGTYEKDELPDGVIQPQKEYDNILKSYKNKHREDLENEFALWGLNKQDFENDLQQTVDIKVSNKGGLLSEYSATGEMLRRLGYNIEELKENNGGQVESGIIKGVKYSDLLKLKGGQRAFRAAGDDVNIGANFDLFFKEAEILSENKNVQEDINNLFNDKKDLQLRKAALRETYLFNINPASQKISTVDFVQTVGKELAASAVGFFDRDAAFRFKESTKPTKRESLDRMQQFLTDAEIPISNEQKENFKRSVAFELFGEALPGFAGDLMKFGFTNKVVGAAGITARIAKLSKTNPIQAFMATNLLEGAKFSAVMADTDMFFNGFFFGAGSQAAAKILPKLGGALAPYQRTYEKIIGGGFGMASGSEVEQFAHALTNDAMGNKAFQTSMDDLYGEQSDAGRRITINLGMGAALGGVKVNYKTDLAPMSARRSYALEIQNKIINGEFKGTELLKKQALLDLLNKDIARVDQQFNELDLGSQKEARDNAQLVIESGQIKILNPVTGEISTRKATPAERKEARNTINKYEINKNNAEREIRKYEQNIKKSGIFGENFKVKIGKEENFLGEGNKAEFDGINTVSINLNKYRPGVFAQEIGHAMMKAGFGKNRKAATIFKDKIQETVNNKLKNERFTVGEKKGLTFEEAIKEAYKKKKNQQPEEYVMNVVEFLSQPKYKHLLLESGIINDFKRSTLLTANKLGLDYTNKKNFQTGEQMLEFLFSIGKIAEGGSAKAIRNKFEAFRNIVIDGKKLYNKTTGKEITKPEIEASKFQSKQIVGEKLTPEIQKSVTKNINDLKIARQESIELNKKFNKEGIKTFKEESIERKIIDDIKPTVDSFAENRTKALYDPIAADAKKNVTRDQFRESIKTDLNQMVLNEYDPAKKGKDGKVQTVEKFITNRGFLRANAAAKNLGIKSVEQGIDKQIETSKEANSLTENIVNTRIEPTKKSGTPSVIQANLKVNGKRITEKETTLRNELVEEADAVLEKVADLGFKPTDKGFRKALANEIKINNPKLFDKFTKELGDYNNFINENYTTILTNKKALPLEFYVQAEKFRANKGENMFVQKVKRATKQAEIRQAIRDKKATYTENEAQGVLVYNRLNPPKAKGLEFFKIPNVKKRLIETLYKTSIVDAVINQSRTKKIYSTSEKAAIAEKFQKERDVFYSAEIKQEKQKGSVKSQLYGEKGYFENAKEEFDNIKNLIDQVAESKNPYTKEILLTYLENSNIAPNNGMRAGLGKFIGNGSRKLEAVAELYDSGVLTSSAKVREYGIKKLGEITQGPGTKALKSVQTKKVKINTLLKKGSDPLLPEYLGEMIDAMAEMFKYNRRAAANLFYNQNANTGINRQASKTEFGNTQTKKPYFEHLLQNGYFNLIVNEVANAKTPLIAAKLKDMLVKEYRQWVVPEKLANILDKSYETDSGTWNAKFEPHPFFKRRVQEIIEGKDVKAPSSAVRIFNEQIIKAAGAELNPFKYKNGKRQLYPETLGINVPKQFQKLQEVQVATSRLISDILFERTNDIKGSIKTLNKMLPLHAQQSKAALKISKGEIGIYEQAIREGEAANKAAKQKQIEVFNSKDISGEFNSYLEKSTGIKKEAVFGAATAMARGKQAKTDFGDYFIPVGAEDFAGLMHKTLARGKQGEKQLEFYDKVLYEPYNRAVEAMTNEAMALKNDFKALKKQLTNVPKTLKEFTEGGIFTKEQAVRVSIWNKLGYEIPGISKKVKAELLKTVKDNAELNTFANEIIKMTKGDGYAKPKESWVAGNIAIDMVNLLNTTKRTKHLEVWQNNVDQIFSKENLFKLEAAYGAKYVKTLKGTLERMKTGSNRKWGANETVEKWNDWINGSVGAIMFLNTRSAVLQTISNINYLNFKDNNPLQAAKAFANQKQYWTDFNTLFNSQYLQSRRGGNKINVNESELALAQQKGGVQGVIALMLNKGFVLTRMADSFAIATGGATMYRNRLNSYKKQGLSEKEAKKKAFTDFMKITEETQQSSRPDRISEQQASSLGRFMLAFANTPMQYNRIIKRNLQDLIAGRGDPKEKMTKITYYGMIQNIIFNAMQKALFVSAFSDEEDDKQQARTVKVGEGMADSLLRGSGLYGNAAVAIKNVAKAVAADKSVVEAALTISPPMYSKAAKLRNANFSRKYITKNNMFEPSLDNPALNAGAQFSSAVFNFPLDRAIRKAQNIEAAVSEDAEYWQRVALALGWGEWELGMDEPKKKRKTISYSTNIQRSSDGVGSMEIIRE